MATMNVVVMNSSDNGNGTRTVTLQNRSIAPGDSGPRYRQLTLVVRADRSIANAAIGSEHILDGRWEQGGNWTYEGDAG
jgi:hypothetical protein